MTQYYKMPGFSLSNANRSTKVLLTLFLLTVLGGLAIALMQYLDRAGFGDVPAREWILGNEGDLQATEIKPPKSYRELLALTHDHVFALPMLLFILLHLVALCTIGERWKIAIYLAGFLSLLGSLSGPWLIAYRGAEWSSLMRWSGTVMASVIGGSALLCLYETWLARPLRHRRHRPEPPAPHPLLPRA